MTSRIINISGLMMFLLLTLFCQGQNSKKVEDFFGLAKISFDNKEYGLAWSSHPNASYFKQEYIKSNEQIKHFKRLITIDLLFTSISIKEIANNKIAELRKLKTTNPLVNYQIFEKGNEIMLDFILSAASANGKNMEVVERNVYRYKSIINKQGQKAILLFGVSDRAYNNDIDTFLKNLKTTKSNLLNAVGAFTIPKTNLEK